MPAVVVDGTGLSTAVVSGDSTAVGRGKPGTLSGRCCSAGDTGKSSRAPVGRPEVDPVRDSEHTAAGRSIVLEEPAGPLSRRTSPGKYRGR